MLGAAKLLGYWNPGPALPPIVFYFFTPIILGILNCFPVEVSRPGRKGPGRNPKSDFEQVYGWIETVSGFSKLVIAIVVSCILYHIAVIGLFYYYPLPRYWIPRRSD